MPARLEMSDETKKAVLDDYARKKSLRKTAEKNGISYYMARRIVRGQEREDPPDEEGRDDCRLPGAKQESIGRRAEEARVMDACLSHIADPETMKKLDGIGAAKVYSMLRDREEDGGERRVRILMGGVTREEAAAFGK